MKKIAILFIIFFLPVFLGANNLKNNLNTKPVLNEITDLNKQLEQLKKTKESLKNKNLQGVLK